MPGRWSAAPGLPAQPDRSAVVPVHEVAVVLHPERELAIRRHHVLLSVDTAGQAVSRVRDRHAVRRVGRASAAAAAPARHSTSLLRAGRLTAISNPKGAGSVSSLPLPGL